ncbi:MAG: bifunctional phosphoglucose/phosphomannose isomerase [Candidatus Woesearchaeota archaeon]
MKATKESFSESLEKYADYIIEASKLGNFRVKRKINKIVVCGVGGSGIAADLIKSYLENEKIGVPVIVNKDFELNPSVDSKTLVFVISYSGNTLETISCYEEAIRKKCKIIAITSGGKVEELCRNKGTTIIKIPGNLHARASLQFLFIPMLNVITKSFGIKRNDFEDIAEELNDKRIRKQAVEISKKIRNRIPITYSSQKLKPVILRWKQQFNENCKIPAFCNIFPELCHNEIESYEFGFKESFVIILMDREDNRMTNKEILAFKDVLSEKRDVELIFLEGKNFLQKLFFGFYLGDLVSFELAKLLKTDVNKIDLIEKLKEKIND